MISIRCPLCGQGGSHPFVPESTVYQCGVCSQEFEHDSRPADTAMAVAVVLALGIGAYLVISSVWDWGQHG